MKKYISLIIFTISSFVVYGQKEVSFGIHTRGTYNFNIPDKNSVINEFEIITAYPSFLIGHDIQYSINEKFSLQTTFSFHIRKLGLFVDYNNPYYYTYSLIQFNTITYSLGVGANYFLTRFHKNKAILLFKF